MPFTIINRRKKIKSCFPRWILQSKSIKLESYYCFTSLAFLSNFWLFSLCFITTAWIFYDSLAIFSRRVVKRPEKLVSLKICNSWPFLVWFLSCHHGSYGLEYLFCGLFDMLTFGLFPLSLWSKRSDFWRKPESHWPADWQKSKKILKIGYQEKESGQETSCQRTCWH